jgi:hypothetical protein
MAEQNATFVMSITFLLRRDFGAIAKVAHSKGTHYFEIENNISVYLILIMIQIVSVCG